MCVFMVHWFLLLLIHRRCFTLKETLCRNWYFSNLVSEYHSCKCGQLCTVSVLMILLMIKNQRLTTLLTARHQTRHSQPVNYCSGSGTTLALPPGLKTSLFQMVQNTNTSCSTHISTYISSPVKPTFECLGSSSVMLKHQISTLRKQNI